MDTIARNYKKNIQWTPKQGTIKIFKGHYKEYIKSSKELLRNAEVISGDSTLSLRDSKDI